MTMPLFRYVAVESAEQVHGQMDAPNKSAVVDRLHAAGQVPIKIDEIGSVSFATVDLFQTLRASRISTRALALLTDQLATLLRAGLALDEALGLMVDLTEKRRERHCLSAVREGIAGGKTLADAMEIQRQQFPEYYISMVRAGEASGSLEIVLRRLAEFLDKSEAARERIKSALIYPAIVALTCCVSIGVIFGFVVPRFRPFFAQAGDKLPDAARAMLFLADVFQNYWWACLLLLVVLVIVVSRQLKNPQSRRRWESLLLKIPVVGDLIRKVEVARFCRTLGTLLTNGVSLVPALTITVQTIRNAVFHEAVDAAIERVQTGKGLGEPLMQSKIFPPLAVHLVRVGEESGRQEEMLFKVADIFEVETGRSIERILSMLTPALTIGLGLIVAGVVGSILTAILSVYDLAV